MEVKNLTVTIPNFQKQVFKCIVCDTWGIALKPFETQSSQVVDVSMHTKQATAQETAGTFKSIQYADPTGIYNNNRTSLNGYFGKKKKNAGSREMEAWQDETVSTCKGPVNIVATSVQKSQNTDLSLHVTKFSCSAPDTQHLTSLYNYSFTVLL